MLLLLLDVKIPFVFCFIYPTSHLQIAVLK